MAKYKKEYSYLYDVKLHKNINFLQHMIECIKGNKPKETIDATIRQLEQLVKEQKDNIKMKKKFGRLK